MKFPVLMYHRIVSSRCPVPGGDAEESRYAVAVDEFEWQLDRIASTGRRAVSMGRVVERLAGGEAVPGDWVGFTFDDGNESDHAHAMPMLGARGFTATFFVCGNRVGTEGGLEADAVAAMAASGMHIGSHGMTHRFLTTLDARDEEDELVRSRDLLAGITGTAVDHFAPPGGRYGTRTLEALRRLGYRAVCTSRFGYNPAGGERFVYRRMPVTAATTRTQFDAMIARGVAPLVGLYARSSTLSWLRRSLGEGAYRRLRSAGLRGR